MITNEQDTSLTILNATKDLLRETEDIERITVRQIAARAGVGIGLINYYFDGKDDLISAAVSDFTLDTIREYTERIAFECMDPVERLRVVIKYLLELGSNNTKFVRFVFSQNILKENMRAPLRIIPLLRDIFKDERDETQLRVMSLQILYPLQAAGLDPFIFQMYSGLDLRDRGQRDQFADMLIDSVIH
jgi:AcrR family transcriptional regulator